LSDKKGVLESQPLFSKSNPKHDARAMEACASLKALTCGNEQQIMAISRIASQNVGNARHAALYNSGELKLDADQMETAKALLKKQGKDPAVLDRMNFAPVAKSLKHQISRTPEGWIRIRTLHVADPFEQIAVNPANRDDKLNLGILLLDQANSVFHMETEFFARPDGTLVPGAPPRVLFFKAKVAGTVGF
jgi:hypothetical protein